MHASEHLGVTAHAEIVIGTPHGHPLLLRGHVRTRKLLGKPVDVVEIAIGFVLTLLVKLRGVESFIIKAGGLRGGWGGGGNGGGARAGVDRGGAGLSRSDVDP